MKPTKISAYKGVTDYAYWSYRITTERKRSGDGVYKKRQNWTNVIVTHIDKPGYLVSLSSLADAMRFIKSETKAIMKRLDEARSMGPEYEESVRKFKAENNL